MLRIANADLSLHSDRTVQSVPPAILGELAAEAGVRFNGDAPWDIQVHDERVYARILNQGSLGFGEAYMDGLWDCDQLDALFHRLLDAEIDEKIDQWTRLRLLGEILRHSLFNLQSSSRAFQVGEHHYDIGNDVFEAMLDPSMSYSCGYWKEATNLAQAQFDKLDLICRKLELQPGERLLEIGCGWGGLAHFAAKHYGVEVVGITVSKEQMQFAQTRCDGLPVTIKLMDYRDLSEQYDKVVSVGMFEHVGPKNYSAYFDVVQRTLKNDGLFLLHTIGGNITSPKTDSWIDKYIFPNGKIPSAKEITASVERRFVIEDWHNFGSDYDRTLMAWWGNFDRAWPNLAEKYGKRFYRMWKYYLLMCAGFFRSGQGQLWQIVLGNRQRPSIYRSVR
ncbi:MAG: cyclopropane-fatty-acyl-phospholipid synthase [Halothiobacillus sp. 24-54-40]|jgi:cyclopropane-fatty-acyl-phospholipid synthase|nr:MAG: cyclopropane-fatty-acyl-phospholipid synthase [Halothiobacillus sp. 20-53-49]OYY39592.1 MAG: cyclopropane-fatty-acyl-phospholipid synthase [Halothiobacillus sp. 35-54-62]OYZ86648.1 MAG: cyclopropane-fatty-acyl-phospholipid synthase [Halothiobacillus sp. 24-54-40]OZA81098.1 MAG: cyclopropane-fatty-acyl-phospholipid synthase [Halothiobacillus sp. 39-53-45]HQS03482.1 cyclopropane fatty acyl phospholipid synthase [Halothiobacillus sp.]